MSFDGVGGDTQSAAHKYFVAPEASASNQGIAMVAQSAGLRKGVVMCC